MYFKNCVEGAFIGLRARISVLPSFALEAFCGYVRMQCMSNTSFCHLIFSDGNFLLRYYLFVYLFICFFFLNLPFLTTCVLKLHFLVLWCVCVREEEEETEKEGWWGYLFGQASQLPAGAGCNY